MHIKDFTNTPCLPQSFFSTSLTIFFVSRLRPRTSAASTQCSIEVESSRNECNVGERLRGVLLQTACVSYHPA